MSDVFTDFLLASRFEGWNIRGYVPDPYGSNSGVTIANGFDLGAHSVRDLQGLGLPSTLWGKLAPYCGKRGPDALRLLRTRPLQITQREGDLIRVALYNYAQKSLIELWDRESSMPWNSLPKPVRQVVASVSYQYGLSMRACPRFRQQALTGDWKGMLDNLRNFGDRYPTRRNREGDVLERYLEETEVA